MKFGPLSASIHARIQSRDSKAPHSVNQSHEVDRGLPWILDFNLALFVLESLHLRSIWFVFFIRAAIDPVNLLTKRPSLKVCLELRYTRSLFDRPDNATIIDHPSDAANGKCASAEPKYLNFRFRNIVLNNILVSFNASVSYVASSHSIEEVIQ